ncbi:glycosyltransferase [Polaribacter sp. Asnod1-A03]|uniref:glycosyltransferase n=1 Tax=Polaribacter sp. Asnod1-A03 TaxID=3160581 RepID=UPI003868DE78
MKVLHVIGSMNPETGGVCKAVRDIIDGMKILKSDIINSVLCLDPKDASYLKEDPFTVIALEDNRTGWSYSKALMPWLKKHVKNYDLLIVHGLWQYQSFAVCKAAKATQVPYYVMPHGMLDPYFQKAKERKLKAIRNRVFWEVVERNLVNSAEGLLFTCEEEKQLARTTFKGYRPNSEKVVGLGVDVPPKETIEMEKALKAKVPEWNENPFWLFLSRIHPKKGVDLLIDAYIKLEKEHSVLPQLIIAGPGGETEYGQMVFEKAKGSKHIYFPGMLSGDARWGAFYKAEAFVLTSHQENFGFAVVEAISCGTPVLISDKVNIWREIKNGNVGMVEVDTKKGAYELLSKWFRLNNVAKENYAEETLKVYQKYFDVKEVSKQFVKAIKR